MAEAEQAAEAVPSGAFQFSDGSQYNGEYSTVEGRGKVRHGRGQYLSTTQERYVGQWVNDKMSGEGTYTFSSGCVYTGGFVDGFFEGFGTYSWPDGAKYVGSWMQSKMHGEGVYTDANKIENRGTWYNGLFDSGRSYVSVRPASIPS